MILCHVCRTILKGRPAQTQRPAASQSFWTIDCSYFHPTVFIPTTIASSYRILMEKLRSLRTAAIQHRDFLQLLLWDPVWGRGCQRTTGFDLWGLCYNFDLIVCTLHSKKWFWKGLGVRTWRLWPWGLHASHFACVLTSTTFHRQAECLGHATAWDRVFGICVHNVFFF